MNWINGFELMCYIICALSLIDMLRKKDTHALSVFFSAALVGYIMEMLAVRVTDIYYYSDLFWFSLGTPPYQFPFFGGLMWGGLTVHAMRLADKFKWNRVMSAFAAGMMIVTMDLFLDVAAIRLDGGFWVWAGRDINLMIDQHMFMSVIWVNFVGYLIETPTVSYLAYRMKEKIQPNEVKKLAVSSLKTALIALAVTSVGSLAALLMNALTDDWFSCILFVSVWGVMMCLMLKQAAKMKLLPVKNWDWMSLIFYLAMYIYVTLALIHLEIGTTHPWMIAFCLACAGLTGFIACAKADRRNRK